jgi:hypothetical protein
MRRPAHLALALTLIVSAGIAGNTPSTEAGDKFFRRRVRPVVETVTTSRPEDRVAPSPMLGSFRPTPYIMVRGNGVVGSGYSPLGNFGRENSMSVYGPLSAFREVSAPVVTVVRGYNGLPVAVEGTSFSNPFQPTLSPVVYPSRASNYSALRYQTTPPQLDRGLMWIDQN